MKTHDLSRGSRDAFRLQLQSVGDVTKLTMGHENKGRSPDWHLDRAELTDESTGKFPWHTYGMQQYHLMHVCHGTYTAVTAVLNRLE